MYTLLHDLRKLNYDFYDERDSLRERHLFTIQKFSTEAQNLRLALRILNFVKNSGILQRTGTAFINRKEYCVTAATVIRELEGKGEYKSKYEGLNQIKYDQTKLKKLFPDQFMIQRLMKNDTTDSDGTNQFLCYTRQLEYAIQRNQMTGQKNGLAIKLRKVKAQKNHPTLTDEEYKSFLSSIKYYTPWGMRKIHRKITDEQIRYFNFLLKGNRLNNTDKERLILLQKMMMTEEPAEIKDKSQQVEREEHDENNGTDNT